MKLALIKKKLIKSVIILGTAILTGLLAFNSTLAWFANMHDAKPNISGSVHASYFAGGTGTESDPYQINLPVQLYYFAWLQDLGVFNTDENGTINQVYFQVTANLDMTGYVLPPAGTPTYPFVGNFDGNNHKISNLTVSNESLTDVPATEDTTSGYQIVGFFGVVGQYAENWAYTYDTDVCEIKNFLLSNVLIKSTAPDNNRTLVGIGAGYLNGEISGVGVYNCKIQVGDNVAVLDGDITDKLSMYSLIGYSKTAYDAYMGQQGNTGADWGGSLQMEAIHKRLNTVFSSQSRTNIMYAQNAYTYYDIDNNLVSITKQGNGTTAYYRVYDYNNSAGAFMLAQRAATEGNDAEDRFFYVNGGIRTTVTREYYYADVTAYAVADNTQNYYLAANENYNGIEDSDTEEAWMVTNNYYYVQKVTIPSNNPSTNYYLNKDSYGRLTLTTSQSTTWTRSGTAMYNGTDYIVHVNGADGGFGLSTNARIYKFGQNTNFLSTNGSTITTTTSSNATEWMISSNYIHTVINNTHYYLNRSGTTGLAISTTPSTQWTIDGNYLIADNGYYLQYNGSSWVLSQYNNYIVDASGNYLTLSGGTLTNTTNQANATLWVFSNSASGGTISSGNYYLRNNNNVLTTTTTANQATSWTISNNQITNNNYDIQYVNGYWSLIRNNYAYYIGDASGNYLTFNGTSFGNTTTASEATIWNFSNGASGGTISVVLNGTTYYLRNNNGTFETTTTSGSATSWTISNNQITNGSYYIQHSGDTWIVTQYLSYIVDASGNYLTLSGANLTNTTDQASATKWEFSNGASGGTIKSGNYYLRNNNNVLETTTNSGNASTWTISNNKITNSNYDIQYINGYWSLTRDNYSFRIVSSGNYLTFDGSSFGNTTTAANGTVFDFSNGSSGGNISVVINGTKYYIYNNNGTLAYTTNAGTATSWTVANNLISDGNIHFQYDGEWKLSPVLSYIVDASGNYMSLSGSSLVSTNQAGATKWGFSNGTTGGTISANGYYLRNNNGILETTTNAGNATDWTVSNNQISNNSLDIQYINGQWSLINNGNMYRITDGTNYLTFDGSSFGNTTTAASGTVWELSNGASGGTISVVLSGTKYYLYNNGGTLGTTTNAGSATSWTIANNQIRDGQIYLQYDSGWKLSPFTSYIKSGSNYMTLNGSSIGNTTSEGSATKWEFSNSENGGTISYNGYYLRNNNGTLELTTTVGNATSWTIEDDVILNGSYCIQYDGGWVLRTVSYYISDGSGNYLSVSAGAIARTNQAGASTWVFSNGPTGGYISTTSGSTYYLRNNGGVLEVTTASGSATSWTVSNDQIVSGDYNVQYLNNYWVLAHTGYMYRISDGTNFLVFNGSSFDHSATASDGTVWEFSNGSSGGTISVYLNGTKYYLYNNNNDLGYTTLPGTAATWTIENSKLCTGYRALQYDSGSWVLYSKTGTYITYTSGNTTHYLSYNNNSIQDATSKKDAKAWNFSDSTNKMGTISTIESATTYYLKYSTTTLSLDGNSDNATNWRNDSGVLYHSGVGHTDGPYYIRYSSGWNCAKSTYYDLFNGTYYMVAPSGQGNNVGATASTSKGSYRWQTSGEYIASSVNTSYYLRYRNGTYAANVRNQTSARWQYENGYLTYVESGWLSDTTYYLYYNGSNWARSNSTSNRDTFYRVPYNATALGINDVSNTNFNNPEFLALDLSIDPYSMASVNTASLLNDVDISAYSRINMTTGSLLTNVNTSAYSRVNVNTGSLLVNTSATTYSRVNVNPILQLQNTTITNSAYTDVISSTTGKNYTYRTSGFQSGTNIVDYDADHINYTKSTTGTWASYFPINADETNGYQAVNSNTGYIVGGSYNRTTSLTFPYGAGDIRIAYYPKSSFTNPAPATLFGGASGVTINDGSVRTINGSGNNVINTANYQRYADAKDGFQSMLGDSENKSNVYGLHFMDAPISMDNLVTAKHVLINGETHDNYEMPAASIDFTLSSKGFINFFAGTFFSGNDSFFSLHKIDRDPETTKITKIRLIYAVYETKNTDYASVTNYVYQYSNDGGSSYYYEDSRGLSMSSATVSSDYTKVFDSSWITGGTALTTNAMYYFEVPADAGEYALGSVDGGTGAYLLYLDIGANAGDVDNEVISYLQGIDFVADDTDANIATILAGITAETKPIIALTLKEVFSSSTIGTVQISREDFFEDGVLKRVDITVSNYNNPTSGTSPTAYVRHYYDTTGGIAINVIYAPESSG